MSRPIPRKPVPALDLDTLDHDRWSLSEQAPAHFSLLVFYRGLHCPICKPYLRTFDRQVAEFAERGVAAIAISTDDEARARQTRQEWDLADLTVGYALPIETAREWGAVCVNQSGKNIHRCR